MVEYPYEKKVVDWPPRASSVPAVVGAPGVQTVDAGRAAG